MTTKTKEKSGPDLEKKVKPEKRKLGVFTTNEPISPKKKSKMLTTRELPAYLPNYHGRKK